MAPKLIVLTYRKHEMVRELVLSALNGSYVPEILIVDNTGAAESLPYLKDLIYPHNNVTLVPMVENLGTSAGWNWGMHHYHDESHVLFANDDVVFERDTVAYLEYAARHSDAGLLHGSVQSGVPFNLFMLNTKIYHEIGPFDQTFRPIYYEDDDYAYRLELAGYHLQEVPAATFGHIGSATLKAFTSNELESHHVRFRWNTAYYEQKWGGLPHNETFTTVFNTGIDPKVWHKAQTWILPNKYTTNPYTYVEELKNKLV